MIDTVDPFYLHLVMLAWCQTQAWGRSRGWSCYGVGHEVRHWAGYRVGLRSDLFNVHVMDCLEWLDCLHCLLKELNKVVDEDVPEEVDKEFMGTGGDA